LSGGELSLARAFLRVLPRAAIGISWNRGVAGGDRILGDRIPVTLRGLSIPVQEKPEIPFRLIKSRPHRFAWSPSCRCFDIYRRLTVPGQLI
jgi:hypothetical protein